MKKLLFLLAFIPALLIGQEYTSIEIFNMAGVTGDTTRPVSVKTSYGQGSIAEIDFSDVNCDLLALDFGYGLTDFAPFYLDTIPGVIGFPITLDKTVYTNTYLGVETNGVSIDMSQYNANYYWIHITDNVACTSGKIYLRYRR